MTRGEASFGPVEPLSPAEAEAWGAAIAAPASPGAWHGLAFALIEAGKLDQARIALEQVIALDPGEVMARNNLGIVLQRLGETEAACAAYDGALARDPDNAVAHANLASGLIALGRFEQALTHAEQAARLNPGQIGAYVYAALAQTELGDQAQALVWLDRALAVAPSQPQVMVERADLLRSLGRFDEGLAAALEAAALLPDNPKALNTLGLLHQALGQDEAALAAFDRAIAAMTQPVQVLVNKAVVLLETGRYPEARATLDLALAEDPGFPAAWFIQADLQRFSAGDPDLARMQARLAEPGLSPRDAILLNYALGKAYMDLPDPPRAFAHLAEGGRLKRAEIAYDPKAAAARMEATARTFSAELFQRLGAVGDPSPRPIFIIGMPRSGGTLVEQILAAHPRVAGGGETTHVERLLQPLGEAYPQAVDAMSPAALRAMGEAYVALADPAGRLDRITDKAADNYLHAGLIHLILPGARIIHLRRDPADTCLSCYAKLFTTGQPFSYDLAELGEYYRLYDRLMAHWRAVLPTDRFIEVDYEAVVDDLEGQARRLIAFCGLDWDPACLRFHESGRAVRTASLHQVRQPIFRSGLGRWMAYRDELAPLLAALGDLAPGRGGAASMDRETGP